MLAIAAAILATMGQADPHSKADLVAAKSTVRPGSTFDVALRFRMDPGWHVYWKNPGESGLSPKIDWRLPKGWTAGPIEWPVPERIDNGGVVNYAYEKEVLLLTKIHAPASAKPGPVALKGAVSWLCCKESCIPGKGNVSLALKVDAKETPNPQWSTRLLETRKALPSAFKGLQATASGQGPEIHLRVETTLPRSASEKATFFCSDDAIEPSAAQAVQVVDGGVQVTLKVSPYVSKAPVRLRGLLIASKGEEWAPGRTAIPIDIPVTRSTQ